MMEVESGPGPGPAPGDAAIPRNGESVSASASLEGRCCVCGQASDSPANRFIKGVCGHLKCRSCLLAETDTEACSLCKKRPGPEPYRDDPIECEKCNKIFETVEDLEEHAVDCDESLLHVCPVCDRKFTKTSLLKEHFRVHAGVKPFRCLRCESSFSTKSKLNRHMRIHEGRKAYACKVCDARFNESASLKKHGLIHAGTKPFGCKTCDKTFRDSSNLRKHELKHLGVKYSCKLCDKSYKLRYSLAVHMQSHTDSKPWTCETCEAAFYTKIDYDRHALVHSVLKQFQCKKCKLSFKRKDNLYRHVRNVHADVDPEANDDGNSSGRSDGGAAEADRSPEKTDRLENGAPSNPGMDADSLREDRESDADPRKNPVPPSLIMEENAKRQSVIFKHVSPSTVDGKSLSDEAGDGAKRAVRKTVEVTEMYKKMFPSRGGSSEYVHKKVNYNVKKYANSRHGDETQHQSVDLTRQNVEAHSSRRENSKGQYSAESIELYKKILLPSYKSSTDNPSVGYFDESRNYREEWDKFKKRHCLPPLSVSLDTPPPLAPLSDRNVPNETDRRSESPVLNDINERLSLPKLVPMMDTSPSKKETSTTKQISPGHSNDIHWRRRLANQADSMQKK